MKTKSNFAFAAGIVILTFTCLTAHAQNQAAFTEGTPPIPTNGLKMWLSADAGVTTRNNGQVTSWNDRSGNGNNVTQTDPGSQPALVSNALNGEPAVRFDGTSSYLKLGTALNSGSALPLTLVVVTRGASCLQGVFDSAPGRENVFRFSKTFVQIFNQSPAVELICPTSGAITSVIAQTDDVGDRQLDVYLNGVEQRMQSRIKSPVPFAGGQIGRFDIGPYYDGDIAEMLYYNRALTSEERQKVEAYLNTKYRLMTTPNLTVTPVSSTQARLAWKEDEGTAVQIVRMAGASGIYSPLTTLSGGVTTYLDQDLSPGVRYSYRVRLLSPMGDTPYSVARSVTPAAGLPTVPTYGLDLWLDAGTGVTCDAGNLVSGWTDLSGDKNNITQALEGDQPVLASGGLNGKPVVRFNGKSSYLNLPPDLISTSALPLTLVMVTCGASSMQGAFDSAPGQGNGFRFYQNSVELISQSPMVTIRPAATGAITTVIAQTDGSGNRLLDVYLNGEEQGGGVRTGNTSTVFFYNGQIGRINTGPYYTGDIAEVLMYNRALSGAERQALETYLNRKYGVMAAPNDQQR